MWLPFGMTRPTYLGSLGGTVAQHLRSERSVKYGILCSSKGFISSLCFEQRCNHLYESGIEHSL